MSISWLQLQQINYVDARQACRDCGQRQYYCQCQPYCTVLHAVNTRLGGPEIKKQPAAIFSVCKQSLQASSSTASASINKLYTLVYSAYQLRRHTNDYNGKLIGLGTVKWAWSIGHTRAHVTILNLRAPIISLE